MTLVAIRRMAQNLNVAIKILAREGKTSQIWLIGLDALMRCFFKACLYRGVSQKSCGNTFYTFTCHMVT